MEFEVTSAGRIIISDIPPLLVDLLKQIPPAAECDGEAVEERFFSSPSHDPDETTLRDDWKAHVEPELHSLFLEARQVVGTDLRGLVETDDLARLEFPTPHADAWINALNQARIALVTRHHITEQEMAARHPREIESPRDLARVQIVFYEHLLHWLIEVVEA